MANVAVQADEFAEMNDWKLGDLRGNASLRGTTGDRKNQRLINDK